MAASGKTALIVFAHPEPKSFNGAMKDKSVEVLEEMGMEVIVSDLYAMKFNPVSSRENFKTVHDPDFLKLQLEEGKASEEDGFAEDIKAEHEKLKKADLVIFHFPLWWFSCPAIMKGWWDRVAAYGTAYGGGKWYERGEFAGKKGIVAVTTGGPEMMYTKDGINGDMGDTLLWHINHGMFWFTGVKPLPHFAVWGPARMTPDTRTENLEKWGEHVKQWDTMEPLDYKNASEFGM